MSVRVRNTSGAPVLLTGHTEIRPGETITIPYNIAMRYVRTPALEFDFSNGTLPYRDGGAVKWLTFSTPLHPSGGYGLIGINAIRGLSQQGVNVSLCHPVPQWIRAEIQQQCPDVMPVVTRKERFVSSVGLTHSVPVEFSALPSPRKIGWTMWEATHLPRSWIDLCKLCERIIVPSTGQIPIFEEAGVPISVVPDGMGVEQFTQAERGIDPGVFTFISWSRMSSRKCPVETVDCFQRAFPTERNVRLVMKTISGQFGVGKFGIPEFRDDRITVIDENWKQSQIVDFCHKAHCAVFLSHGEGFYNPPTQAMATGLPVILPNHSGCVDQCNEAYNYPIGLDPRTPYERSPLGGAFGNNDVLDWWVMDYAQVIETMRHVYHNREEAFAKGRAAAQWVRTQFSVERMTTGLLDVLNMM